MSADLILYDVATKAPRRSFSGNTWKTRLALNFKGVPYKTEWIPYIHLQEKVKAFGVPPNPPGSWSEYSLPTVRFADGSYVMDSSAIAAELEARYPTPSLRLNRELEGKASAAMGQVFTGLVRYLLTKVDDIVAPEDLDWFKEDRARRFGMTIEEAFETEKELGPCLDAARPGMETCAEVLRANKVDQGPFILGSLPCYADFMMVASMQMLARLGGTMFEEFLGAAPDEMRKLYEACADWTRRQD